MSNTTILQVSARLEADKRLPVLFDILRDYGDAEFALWLKEDKELSLSFAEMARRAGDPAPRLKENDPEGGWVGIAGETCPNRPTPLWGGVAPAVPPPPPPGAFSSGGAPRPSPRRAISAKERESSLSSFSQRANSASP